VVSIVLRRDRATLSADFIQPIDHQPLEVLTEFIVRVSEGEAPRSYPTGTSTQVQSLSKRRFDAPSPAR
jgi:hypothetical protein